MVNFKGSQFPKAVILYAVWFYVRFPVSYRDLEEIMAERGVEVDHATLNRWVEKFSGQIASEAQKRKAQPARSWRMDETYIKVGGQDRYLYRAVDKFGNTVDFLLTKRRMKGSAQKFFNKAIGNNGKPEVINIDKSGSNFTAIRAVNRNNFWKKNIKVRQCKYLNNIVEQDHRNIKRRIAIDTGFKEFESAQRTLAGMEVVSIIKKNQIIDSKSTVFQTFRSLAA